MFHRISRHFLLCLLIFAIATPLALSQQAGTATKKGRKKPKEDPQQRAKSLQSIAKHLDVGAGSVIADIGAGNGRDTWTFAKIVGESGKVFAEEIADDKTKKLKEEIEKRSLTQVEVVLGGTDDPELPEDAVDMAFMHYVYHHLSEPREMLQGIWKSLKPGGYLVVVDKRLGILQDWVPREQRAKKHFWIAETTVVREAREEGFRFVQYAEQFWHAKETFVLVLQRPGDGANPTGDPDVAHPLSRDIVKRLLPPADESYRRVAFIALGQGREIVGPVLESTSSEAVDIVLEEWATRKDERPSLPDGLTLPSVLTEKGDPKLGPEPIDAVYFLDSYHLLFHGPKLLTQLRERLTEAGNVYILDRAAPRVMPRREASHRRMIAPQTVKQELQKAGFVFVREEPRPADDRFLMVFGKSDAARVNAAGNTVGN